MGQGRIGEKPATIIGVGAMGLSAVCAFVSILVLTKGQQAMSVPLWTWLSVGDFTPKFGLYLDGLSVTMMGVITGVGFFDSSVCQLVYER